MVEWNLPMLDPHRRHHEPAMVIGCLFATTLISGALGALMAFSSSPWYAGYKAIEHGAFGLDPTQDQQIAGLVIKLDRIGLSVRRRIGERY